MRPARAGSGSSGEMDDGGDDGVSRGSRSNHHHNVQYHHPEDCPCHLRIVFETMVDEGWRVVGIGRGGGEAGRGRWVVEFGE